MRRNITNLISVIVSLVRFLFLKVFHQKNLCFYFIERFSPNVIVELEKGGKLILGKKIRVHSGCIFKVRKNAKLILHDECSFNYNSMIFCRDEIEIYEGVEFGPDVKIYDHDHDFRTEGGIKAGRYSTGKVTIGKNVWIGANTVILKGTTIGENCVIGAGCVLKGNYPPNTVVIQKRNDFLCEVK